MLDITVAGVVLKHATCLPRWPYVATQMSGRPHHEYDDLTVPGRLVSGEFVLRGESAGVFDPNEMLDAVVCGRICTVRLARTTSVRQSAALPAVAVLEFRGITPLPFTRREWREMMDAHPSNRGGALAPSEDAQPA